MWVELVLFFGAPLLWGIWQLISLRRDRHASPERCEGDPAQQPDPLLPRPSPPRPPEPPPPLPPA